MTPSEAKALSVHEWAAFHGLMERDLKERSRVKLKP